MVQRPKQAVAAFSIVLVAIVAASSMAFAQTESYKIRITPVPIETGMRGSVTGRGSGTAVLSAGKLTLTGSYEGLQSPATAARVHLGKATGVRGPVIAEISVVKATSGTIFGTVSLKPEQVEDLRKGRVYVQIHSEKAPDGNLWGWLLR